MVSLVLLALIWGFILAKLSILNGLWLRYCGLNDGAVHLDHEACHSVCGHISLCLASSLTVSSSSKPLLFGLECTGVNLGRGRESSPCLL